MPNIMICGFPPKKAKELRTSIEVIMQDIDLGNEAITSIVDMEVKSCDGKRILRPYLRICSTDADEQKITDAFKKAGVKVDVEWMPLSNFIPADEMG